MAIKALTWMVKIFEPPVYCYHEIVHNRFVVEAFESVGVVFVDGIDEVPEGAPVMLSAHGSAPEVVADANARAGVVIDAVCPLVTKVHHEVRKQAADDFEMELARATPEEKEACLERVTQRQTEDSEATQAALKQLQAVAREGGNVFEELMETVKVASLGQITDALFNVGGQYRRNM